jgi:hypoxanthine phosphoribosyltransferase
MMRIDPEPLLTAEQIAARVRELAAEIRRDLAGTRPLVLGVLKGAAFFTADLARALDMDAEVDFIRARSYEGTASSGRVDVFGLERLALKGRTVLLVEDIVDTGATLSVLRAGLAAAGAETVRVCTLLDKPARRTTSVTLDHAGFIVGNQFVVGYGLDYEERFRTLPALHALKWPEEAG